MSQIWKFRKSNKNFETQPEVAFTDYKQKNTKFQNKEIKYKPYLILENVTKNRPLSTLDTKFTMTKDYNRYKFYPNPHKIQPIIQNMGVNIPGVNLTDKISNQYFFIKDRLKYENQEIQTSIIERIFTTRENNFVKDIRTMKHVKEKIFKLKGILEKYGVSFSASSLLVLYDNCKMQADVFFTDFSYFPNELEDEDLKGLEILLQYFDTIIGN